MRIPPRDARMHVAGKGLQDRNAGGDVADVDLEDARHGIGDPDPGEILRFHLPRRGGARDCDAARDDAEAHEAAEGELAAGLDFEVAQQDDGEGGADEVGDEGEDGLRDEYVHDGLRREAVAGVIEVPDFVDGVALEDVEKEEGEVRDDEEGDEGVQDALQFVELGEPEQEEADGDFTRGERDEELGRVEVVVFEEVSVLFHRQVDAVLAKAVADFCYYKSLAYSCDHLTSSSQPLPMML